MDDERLGTIIADRYQLDRVLGRGGMGVVYEGTHKWTQRKLAVKVLQPHVAHSEIAVKRFFQEARAAAALSHPNVVDVLDLGLDDAGDAYIVLELLAGESLEDRLRREGSLSPTDTLDILLPILDALGLAHEHGIIHRDLKPANIFLARDARGRLVPKLLDFGVAKLLERVDANISSPKTRPGAMLGTVHYMAPEFVLHDDAVTRQCDVWSMGVVLYRCLSGALPFEAAANTTLLVMIASTDHKPLAVRAPDVPPGIVVAVEGALRRELSERYAKVDELVAALLAAADASGVELAAATRIAAIASITPPGGDDTEAPSGRGSGDDTIAD
ncbi:MAG: serine/threonine protein kinase [Sandaracinaceae bacterium]|nr:serine/threonine protein kinase [Sandaracinaceae bacterium]